MTCFNLFFLSEVTKFYLLLINLNYQKLKEEKIILRVIEKESYSIRTSLPFLDTFKTFFQKENLMNLVPSQKKQLNSIDMILKLIKIENQIFSNKEDYFALERDDSFKRSISTIYQSFQVKIYIHHLKIKHLLYYIL